MADYKVLIPLDGSPLAEHSLAYLPVLKNFGDVDLHLLSVVDKAEQIPSLAPPEVAEREGNVLTTYLHEVTSDIEKNFGVKPQIEVTAGIPAVMIQERAAALAADLLVISTHGRSGISRWRRGSVAGKLLHGATVPILVVGPKTAGQAAWRDGQAVESFSSILVPLDGSDLAEHALSTAGSIARLFGSEVHLVSAIQTQSIGDGGAGVGGYVDFTEVLEEGAESYLLQAREKLNYSGEVTTHKQLGASADVLESYISNHKIDLVVMTSHGRSGLVRAALGSVTDRLTGNGQAPVLVVRSQEAS